MDKKLYKRFYTTLFVIIFIFILNFKFFKKFHNSIIITIHLFLFLRLTKLLKKIWLRKKYSYSIITHQCNFIFLLTFKKFSILLKNKIIQFNNNNISFLKKK